MTTRSFVWLGGCFVERVLARISGTIRGLTSTGSSHPAKYSLEEFLTLEDASAKVEVALPQHTAFLDYFDTRTAKLHLQRKILIASEWSPPIANEDVFVTCVQTSKDAPERLSLLTLRTDDLSDIEAQAAHLGHIDLSLVAADREFSFSSPATDQRRRSARLWWLMAILCMLIGIWVFLSAWAWHTGERADLVQDQGGQLRQAALANVEYAESLNALELLEKVKTERQTPQHHLETFYRIAQGTPSHSYWQSIDVTAARVKLIGFSQNWRELLDRLRASFPHSEVNLSSAPVESDDGLARIEINIQVSVEGAP